MKALLYTLVLLVLLVSVAILLRSLEPAREPADEIDVRSPRTAEPMVSSPGPSAPELAEDLDNTDASELLSLGNELLRLWHVREATAAYERVLEGDSSSFDVYPPLIECYAHPLLEREDDLRAVVESARLMATSTAETRYVEGLEQLFVTHEFADAATTIAAASRDAALEERFPDVPLHLARAHLLAGQVTDARHLADGLVGDDATDGRALELATLASVADDDLPGAREKARELARIYNEEPYPYVLLALTELLAGHPDDAAEFCNNALVLDANYLPAIVARGNIYAAAGQSAAARVSFEKLLMFDDPVLRAIGEDGIGFVSFLAGDFDDGVDAMDEAVRHAVLAGSARQGLRYAQRLVEYLCELGQADAAEGVVERWVTGYGDIAVALARVRIHLARSEPDLARQVLMHMHAGEDWNEWARTMNIDPTELNALAYVGEGQVANALELLSEASRHVTPWKRARRAFAQGYAAFENGDAETATNALGEVRSSLYSLEFPYRTDPVLAVQALFFLAESALARGDEESARDNYRAFIARWGNTSWELPAVERSQEKLASLEAATDTLPEEKPQAQ